MRLLIVGGVAAGMSAATRARRLDEEAEIIVFEQGRHVSFANCGLPYFIGGAITDKAQLLVQTPRRLRERFNIDVRIRSRVESIDRDAGEVQVRDLETDRLYREPYDKLVLAPGAQCLRPPIPGLDGPGVYCLRDIQDMDDIWHTIEDQHRGRDSRESPARAVVIGAGYIGLEMAENLMHRSVKVAVAEVQPQVMSTLDPEMATPLERHLREKGVGLQLSNGVAAIERDGESMAVRLQDGTHLACDLVVLAVGVRPNTELAKDAGLEIGVTGGIEVDEHLQTSDPDIYAAGDAIEVTDYVLGRPAVIPLAGPANRQGRICADNVCGRESTFRGVQGTAIVKVFDLTVATTGANEKALAREGVACQKVYVHPGSHAGYYPGATPLSMKLLFSTEDGRVLGAQIVGTRGVDKRIDVLAVAIQAGMTVYDLEEAELAYAPPYGSAKDPVNMAGFVAANYLRGDMDIVHADELDGGDFAVLDVRSVGEFEAGHVPGALNVPLDELRDRLGEVPRDRRIAVCCGVGLRAYFAVRILDQNGFDVANIPGGFTTYCDFYGPDAPECAHPPDQDGDPLEAFWADVE